MAAQDYYGSAGQNPYPPAQPTYAPQEHSYGDVDPSKVRDLVAMGFTDAQARQALRETGGDVARAVDWLFNHPNNQAQNHLAPPPAYSRPTSAHSDFDAYQAPSPSLPQRPTSTGPTYAEKQDGQTAAVGPNGEQDKGLLASVAGGAGGAFLGNKLLNGKMGKIMGGTAGAIVANVIESKLKGKNNHHSSASYGYSSNQHSSGGGLLGGLLGGGSHGSNHGGYGGGYGSPSPYSHGGYAPPPQPHYAPGPPPGPFGGHGFGQPGVDQGGHHGGHHGPPGGPGGHGRHGSHGSHGHQGHHGHGGGW